MGGWSPLRRIAATILPGRRSQNKASEDAVEEIAAVPPSQTVFLLHGPREEYRIVDDFPVPTLISIDEVLIKTKAIGLNPIDWKAPDFNFGIPELPYISGRELSGDVVKLSSNKSEWNIGEKVIAISTDYRDIRKGAYQEYVVALQHNLVRIPPNISYEEGSTLGVAFVAAALALGVSLGVNFSGTLGGPDLFNIVRSVDPASIPEDVRRESLDSIRAQERPTSGDWLAIWGGSATSAHLAIQLAKLAGLKVAVVVDKARHGLRISNHSVIRPDLLVDSHDPSRAVEIIKANTGGQVHLGLDTRGRESATHLLQALSPSTTPLRSDTSRDVPLSPPSTPDEKELVRAHLVGLTGLPKGAAPEATSFHAVPIKLFHEVPQVGVSLTSWLGQLLKNGLIVPPDIVDIQNGLGEINAGLDRMRRGEIRGGKLVVRI